MIPDSLKNAIDKLLEGVSRTDLARRTDKISQTYRANVGSQHAIRSKEDALAYLVTRLPATFAAVTAALYRVQQAMPDFTPVSLLDAGAGPGGAAWAACEIWPSIIAPTLFDENTHLLNIGKTLSATGNWQQASLQSAALPQADLVIASYALGEITDDDTVLEKLWQATKIVLLIVEPGTPAGYENIVRWRAILLGMGATVAAPCPHDLPCPIVQPDWCHFAARLARSRDHIMLKNASVPFEDEKFSYLAATKLPAVNRPKSRILAPVETTHAGIACKLCKEGRINVDFTGKRDREAYKIVHRKNWGDGI